MSCPHSSAIYSSPDRCSLCLGIKPRIVKIVNRQSIVTIDGVEFANSDRVLTVDNADANRAPEAQQPSRNRGRTFVRTNKIRRCSLCCKIDHTRAQCSSRNRL